MNEKGLHVSAIVDSTVLFKMASRANICAVGVKIICLMLQEELQKIKKRKTRRRRRWWTRPWILRRNLYGASDCLLKELVTEDPESYRNHLRMNNEQFNELLRKVIPYIQKQNTNMREALPARVKLQITLRFLATGDSYASLSALYRVPKCSISHFVLEVLNAIYEVLKDFIQVSTTSFINQTLFQIVKKYFKYNVFKTKLKIVF